MADDRSSARAPRPTTVRLPADYADLLTQIKARIRTARIKAALTVNRELLLLYWEIGGLICERQTEEGWGKSVVERLAVDIQREFPGISGFSRQNIWYMRAFFLAWTDEVQILQQSVGVASDEFLQQTVGESGRRQPPPAVLVLPWGHNIQLVTKLKDPVRRLWYACQATSNGWSRAMLVHWIESDLYARQGKAVTNFKTTLPPAQSDLAVEVVRDPYHFDFLTLRTDAAERELEEGLLAHIRQFLLELGAGFAFVGQQVHLEVDGEDFYIDLLFYHLKLRCYVVIDLKTTPFRPEYAGKMNFYLSAVDDGHRHPDDQPSIGIILCKTRGKVITEYALRDLAKPIGVARYVTQLVEALPANLEGVLPSPEQIARELKAREKR